MSAILNMYNIITMCFTNIISAESRVYLGIPFTRVTVNLVSEPPIFDFDNPRLLEKALLGKELHRKLLLLTTSTKSTKTTSQKC